MTLRRPSLSLSAGLFLLAGLPAIVACGKKGPPLAPLQTVPGRIEDLAVSRRGDEVRMRLTVPNLGSDGKAMRDIEAVEVYGLSGKPEGPLGQPLSNDELLKYATLVGRTAVKPPPIEETADKKDKKGGEGTPAAETAKPAVPPPFDPRPGQGEPISVTEMITPEVMTPWVHPRKKVTPEEKKELPPGTPLWWPAQEEDFSRMYVAVALNRKGRHSALSNRVSLPLVSAPSAPASVEATHDPANITLTWAAPGNARRPVQEPTPVDLLPSKPVIAGVAPTVYNVYEVTRSGAPLNAPAPTPPPGTAAQPAALTVPGTVTERPILPLNAKPLPTPLFVDARLAFGQERCYVVRALQAFGSAVVESEPSAVACITPVDKFAPAAPKNLSAVASETGVSLIWEPNTESDLAGYIVLRAEGTADIAAATLTALTATPIPDTTYRDTTAKPGVRYVYAIVAVDKTTPANKSGESNRVEATVR